MPALTLNRYWLNLMSTGEGVSAASSRGKGYTVGVDARVDTYANGRRRAISTPGLKRDVPVTLLVVSLPFKDYLEDWLGQNVQLRDTRGQKWFGIFAELTVTEYMSPSLYNVSFTLLGTTTTEGV